ncbi:MAG: hypothetical protein M0Z69_03010 [Actinomycetota bacterium]|nr:hypothetical protein [Actinomycetota bacterium]
MRRLGGCAEHAADVLPGDPSPPSRRHRFAPGLSFAPGLAFAPGSTFAPGPSGSCSTKKLLANRDFLFFVGRRFVVLQALGELIGVIGEVFVRSRAWASPRGSPAGSHGVNGELDGFGSRGRDPEGAAVGMVRLCVRCLLLAGAGQDDRVHHLSI